VIFWNLLYGFSWKILKTISKIATSFSNLTIFLFLKKKLLSFFTNFLNNYFHFITNSLTPFPYPPTWCSRTTSGKTVIPWVCSWCEHKPLDLGNLAASIDEWRRISSSLVWEGNWICMECMGEGGLSVWGVRTRRWRRVWWRGAAPHWLGMEESRWWGKRGGGSLQGKLDPGM